MEDFVHLHVHTYYSVLDGQSSVERLVKKAIDDGQRGIAITDHGNMFGVKDFVNHCAKVNKGRAAEGLEPFKPIIGCEVYVAPRKKTDKLKEKGDHHGYHLILLAKNYVGYKNLVKIVSNAWVDGFYGRPRTDREDIERYHEGLVVCSACIAGEVPRYILNGNMDAAREALEWYKRVFGEDYYLELQRHEVKDPNIRANRETFPLQQKANKVLMELAQEYGVKLICSNDSHFVDKENAEAHDHLLCISTGKLVSDTDRMLYTKQEWMKTREEMNEVFADVPQALRNTCEVLDKVEIYSIDHAPIMPFFPIPESFGTEETIRAKYTDEQLYQEFVSDENGENPLPKDEGDRKIQHLGGIDRLYRIKLEADYLRELTYEGAKKLYGDPLDKEVEERLNFELHIMKTMGFPGYFLIVQDFINVARNELDVIVGPGRGSAAGSVVAYCLGITRIDPMKYDLLFERFLNPDRISLPDIDTDFDDDGRGKVLDWVTQKYGVDKVAHIITYSTMATKMALKDVARVEDLPIETSNQMCKLVPERMPKDPVTQKTLKMNLPNVLSVVRELKEMEVSDDPRICNTIKYAKMLEGNVRGTGIHACGTIICRDPISDWVPVSTADDGTKTGNRIVCTQYEGGVIEETGLIKMDFLGLKTLSIIKEAIENIKYTTGQFIDIDEIPIDDEKTYELYQRGQTVGTFQFESGGMQKYLRELKPTAFEDLIAMNALYRPGPMDYIPEFIARKRDPSRISYDLPCMEKYLKDTYGITVYQEQVMLQSRQLANFTRGQSDTLRKAMGKKDQKKMAELEGLFYEGGQKNGYDLKILEKIWNDWKKFAEYAFNKSHATCYSWVAYQTAYLKAHYPAEYMAAVMSRNKDNITEITKLMDECRSIGVQTLGPDVNESQLRFAANKKGEIRFGLAAIKGMGESASTAIINERNENGAFKDIYDFIQRVNLTAVNKKALESLVLSGGFDSFGELREAYFVPNAKGETFLEQLLRYGQLFQAEVSSCQNSLFGDMGGIEMAVPKFPKTEKWGSLERLNRERELVGIYLSAHPLDDYSVVLKYLCNTHVSEVGRDADKVGLAQRATLKFGGIITNVKELFSQKTNKPFGFVTIEDYEGSGELALFDENWTNWRNWFVEGASILVTAQYVQRFKNSSSYELRLTNVEYLSDVRDKQIEKLTITIPALALNDTFITELESLVEPGTTQLYIALVNNGEHARQVLLRGPRPGIKLTKELIGFLENNGTDDENSGEEAGNVQQILRFQVN